MFLDSPTMFHKKSPHNVIIHFLQNYHTTQLRASVRQKQFVYEPLIITATIVNGRSTKLAYDTLTEAAVKF
jgi:hypothetical protein